MSAVSVEHKDYKVKFNKLIHNAQYKWHTDSTICLRFRVSMEETHEIKFNRKTAMSIEGPKCYFFCMTSARLKSDKQPQKTKVLSHE